MLQISQQYQRSESEERRRVLMSRIFNAARRYPEPENERLQDNFRRLAKGCNYSNIIPQQLLIGCSSPGPVIDIACGQGAFTYSLARNTRRQVTGIDTDEVALEIARKKYASQRNLAFTVADAYRLELDRPASLITIYEWKRTLLSHRLHESARLF